MLQEQRERQQREFEEQTRRQREEEIRTRDRKQQEERHKKEMVRLSMLTYNI